MIIIIIIIIILFLCISPTPLNIRNEGHKAQQQLSNVNFPQKSFIMWPLTFLASTFLYPFGICDVIVARFTVKQRPVEEEIRIRSEYGITFSFLYVRLWLLSFGVWSKPFSFSNNTKKVRGSFLLPFYFFGVTGDEEAQRPLLHLHVVSRVYQGAMRVQKRWKKNMSQLSLFYAPLSIYRH